MLINLKVYAGKAEQQTTAIELIERLPARIVPPCVIHCRFSVKSLDNYYIIMLDVNSNLTMICQRCLNEFTQQYINQTTLAVCNSEEIAEKLMNQYECIVAHNSQVDLNELLTDELYLYTPEFHPEISDCDDKILNLLAQKKVDVER